MFTDRGINPIIGAELYRVLGLGPMDERDSQKMDKVVAVAKFLERQPDPLFVIGKIAHNRSQMSNLDFLAGYAQLSDKLEGLKAEQAKYEGELKHYE